MEDVKPGLEVRIMRAACAPLVGQLGKVESVDGIGEFSVEYTVLVLTGEFAGRRWVWLDDKDRLSVEPA